MNKTKITSLVMLVIWVALAVFLIYSISDTINETKRIERLEAGIIEQLKMIREAENAYLSVNGRYTGDWDQLTAFVDSGRFYITEKTEQVFQLAYGADSVHVTIDTLGTVSVMDSLFTADKWPDFNLNTLAIVPGVTPSTTFALWADKITKAGVEVNVIEVVNPTPVDPNRDEDSELNTKRPLRFGSRTNVTTTGNWE